MIGEAGKAVTTSTQFVQKSHFIRIPFYLLTTLMGYALGFQVHRYSIFSCHTYLHAQILQGMLTDRLALLNVVLYLSQVELQTKSPSTFFPGLGSTHFGPT